MEEDGLVQECFGYDWRYIAFVCRSITEVSTLSSLTADWTVDEKEARATTWAWICYE